MDMVMARVDATDTVKDTDMEIVTITVKVMGRKDVITTAKDMGLRAVIMVKVTDRCTDMDLATAENTTEALAEREF